jgi:hypothetical protein
MTHQEYGLAPLVAVEGTRFLIPSLGDDNGGRAFSFANEQDLLTLKKYYDDLGRQSAAFYSYTFVKGDVLVQINGDLAQDKAQKYNDALQTLH